ncbi:peroxisomal biogenesis factor 11 [Dunaliella salina]|uniref:Peroxisomal biogenesis factor 11 n=1 Tax=Dunaliella salina TaxID=3046 RepID=A0ABQ7GF90_DUNSA|nr:peroxisomal biogenesis factor 11 [Dunaliella salina]|eukprot:KAF5833224.1 peroxisomal biogenesis factor 11 [Dunaliella salina]
MSSTSPSLTQHLQVIKGFSEKADGKDKLTALIQYVCMFLSANEPGNIKKVQASVTAARKVFRVMRPLESMTPLLVNPKFNNVDPKLLQAINRAKSILMAVYFGADHFVWACQIGLLNDKQTGERFQKVSLSAWALGSVCTIISESWQIARLSVTRKENETDEKYEARVEEARKAINQRMLLLVHGVFQVRERGLSWFNNA